MENKLTTVELTKKNRIATVTLNRPKVKNAFNETLISELLSVLIDLKTDKEIRVIVIQGKGDTFCSGADLNWMKGIINYSYQENLSESLKLAELLREIYIHPKPVIAKVIGPAVAGGTGLVASCDFVVASKSSWFRFSEVKIGLVPACIAPYLYKRMGERNIRRLFITGEKFDVDTAHSYGLVDYVEETKTLDSKIENLIKQILSSSPAAITKCKLLNAKVSEMEYSEYKHFTAELIANLRISDEGQDGMNAFFNKTKPSWIK